MACIAQESAISECVPTLPEDGISRATQADLGSGPARDLASDRGLYFVSPAAGGGGAGISGRGLLLVVEPAPRLVLLRPSTADRLDHGADHRRPGFDRFRGQAGGGALVIGL